MNEDEAIRKAEDAAAEAGYPWNPTSIAVKRNRALFVFPVWLVSSALPDGSYYVRATIPDGATHATRLEMFPSHRRSSDIDRLRVIRVAVEIILFCIVAFAAVRRFIPSGVVHDAAITAAFTLLSTVVIESYIARRHFSRELRNSRND